MSTRSENIVVVAGAGAGKTYALVQEYLFALLGLDGSYTKRQPKNVFALTFTEKAAAEMRARVATRLLELAGGVSFDDPILARAKSLNIPMPKGEELCILARRLADAPICTFHSLAGQILRDYAHEAGIDPGYELLDPIIEKEMFYEVAEATVLDALANDTHQIAALVSRFNIRGGRQTKGLVETLVGLYSELSEYGIAAADLLFAGDKNGHMGSYFKPGGKSLY